MRASPIACLVALAAACSAEPGPVLQDDAGAFDGGSLDADSLDAPEIDGTTFDAESFDAETVDVGGPLDTGSVDGGTDGGDFDAGADAGPAMSDAGPVSCPTIGPATAEGHINVAALIEISGLVVGRVNPDVYWAHNDQSVDLYAIDRSTLSLRAHYQLLDGSGDAYGDGDVEDIAIRALPTGGAEIFLGDIGSGHPDLSLHVYRVEEPLVPAGPIDDSLPAEVMNVSALQLRNAETLLLDPIDGTLLILQKTQAAHACELGTFVAGSLVRPSCTVLVPGIPNPSGGDVSADGRFVAVRNEGLAFVWIRPNGAPLVQAFATSPCPFASLATPSSSDECNGEALGFDTDGSSLISASEMGGCATTNVHSYTFLP